MGCRTKTFVITDSKGGSEEGGEVLSPEDVRVPEAAVVLQSVVMGLVLHNGIRRQAQNSLHGIPIINIVRSKHVSI
jgi:hypothetical protein